MAESNKIYGMLKTYFRGKGSTPRHSEILEMAKQFFQLICPTYTNEMLDGVVEQYEENIAIRAFEPDVLIDKKVDSKWFEEKKKDTSRSHKYWERYADYLSEQDFDEDTIEKIKTSTEETLGYCANPTPETSGQVTKRKGLVVGDVQSGKTANYLALINLACDYDYKLFVILAGMTDSLRLQTQKRVDSGLIGAVSNTIGSEKIEFIGVGETFNDYYAVSLTNQNRDFNRAFQENNNTTAFDYNKPIVLVIKKNKSTLENVISWLKPGSHGIKDHIMIIDDEADNASVNTKKPDDDPSTINELIRQLYNNFPISTYVGYTATPFANIFINPNDEESYKDLFPSDFIIMLNTPDSYFGAKKVFGEKNNGETRYIRELDEEELNFLQVNHKKDDAYPGLSESLKEAILSFFINSAITTKRGKPNAHRSMMINISRFNKMQFKIRDAVAKYVNNLKNVIFQTSFMPKEKFLRDKDMLRMYNLYMTDPYYNDLREEFEWEEIQKALGYESEKMKIIVVNRNKDEEKLDYEAYKTIGARYIVIGGFVLSRGLTLEGLIVSYYSRNGSAYDTLLQMCRWFGYRRNYEDICRIYMSRINIDSFLAVVDATNDLKEQFRRMIVAGKTPNDFGLMVKMSPEILHTLLVTARNKMRAVQDKTIVINYSSTVADTSKIYWEKKSNDNNLNLIKNYLESRFGELEEIRGRYLYRHVDKKIIADIVRRLQVPTANKKFDTLSIADFIEKTSLLNEWDVAIATGSRGNEEWGFGGKKISKVKRTFYLRQDENGEFQKYIYVSHHSNRLLDPGILDCNLDPRIVDEIRATKKDPTAEDYLKRREIPLLVIYPILLEISEPKSEEKRADRSTKQLEEIKNTYTDQNPLLGFALAFPFNGKGLEVKYKLNVRKQEELEKEREEMEDEDDEN